MGVGRKAKRVWRGRVGWPAVERILRSKPPPPPPPLPIKNIILKPKTIDSQFIHKTGHLRSPFQSLSSQFRHLLPSNASLPHHLLDFLPPYFPFSRGPNTPCFLFPFSFPSSFPSSSSPRGSRSVSLATPSSLFFFCFCGCWLYIYIYVYICDANNHGVFCNRSSSPLSHWCCF